MDGTAAYYLTKDWYRVKMRKWGLLFTKQEMERARRREKSVRRNDPSFTEEKDSVTPELYR